MPKFLLLDRDGEVTAVLPDEKGRATVIRLEALRITAIEYLADEDAIRAAVESMPPAPAEARKPSARRPKGSSDTCPASTKATPRSGPQMGKRSSTLPSGRRTSSARSCTIRSWR